ncbi:TonB-like; putative TolA function [hydrothermal vent metagenome]|uniref:TonB-like putative TolA function n=1 Tax=hydrothermal vent metagenome TaxID=652676 RepID=A0A1W1D3I3_9ZZZZ
MVNNKYFYLSGFLSLLLFFLGIFLFIYMAILPKNIKHYALKKKHYISISLQSVPNKKEITLKQEKKAIVPVKSSPQEDVSSKPIESSKDIDVADLFSDVWTKKITPKKVEKQIKHVDNTVLKRLKKKVKTLDAKPLEKTTSKVENIIKKSLIQQQPIQKQRKQQDDGNEVNKYLAKINAIVYSYFNPPEGSEGFSVYSVIVLSPFGKVIDFKILQYSSNESLNQECDRLKRRLMHTIFPVSPDGTITRTKIILTSKE